MHKAFSEGFYYAAEGEEYHSSEACEVGRAIPAEERLDGTGGLPLCPQCQELSRGKADTIPRRTFNQ
jgi:hypothetical protein